MRFVYSMLKQSASRAPKLALLVLVISLIAFGGLRAHGSASPQDRFSIVDAATTEENSTKLRPKEGFELLMKDKVTVVARRLTKGTESYDAQKCQCSDGCISCCAVNTDQGTGISTCFGHACCKWYKATK